MLSPSEVVTTLFVVASYNETPRHELPPPPPGGINFRPQDNNSIYYEPVPDLDMLDPLPQPVLMMKPLPSEEGPPPTKTLSFRATGSTSDGESGGASGLAEADKPAEKTDEELARALHEQLNT